MPEHVYIEMTIDEVKELPRDKTVFFSAISPLEVHGPHLPIGTDIFLAETLRDRVKAALLEKRPELHAVILPTLPLGSQAIPPPGSFKLRPRNIENTLLDWGRSLHGLGFKFWLLSDNHGGPTHQMAIGAAADRLAAGGFHIVAPFNFEFRQMLGLHPDLLSETGLRKGNCGDSTDSHAGTNETSLMRAAHPRRVRDVWQTTGPAKEPPFKPLHKLLDAAGGLFEKFGWKDAALDFHFFAHGLAWIMDPDMDPYSGDPSVSDPANGEKMLAYRAKTGLRLLESALDGNPVTIKHMGRSVRFLRNLIP